MAFPSAATPHARADRIAELVRDLGSDDPATLIRAAEGLVSIGPPAIPQLRKALSGSEPRVRQAVPEVLVAIGPQAVPALCEALQTPDGIVQWGAVRGLRKLGPKAATAMPCLAAALRVKTSLATEAAWALQSIGEPAVPTLVAALHDPFLPEADGAMNVRSSIVSVLGHLRVSTTTVVDAIARLLFHKDSYVRYQAAEALGELGPLAVEALPQLRKASADPEEGPRQAALRAIERITRTP